MESFFYSVNATAPVFLVILLGYTLRRIGILDEHFVSVCNRFNFKITLPVMLFVQMTETSLRDNFSGGFVLLCAVITVLSAVGIWIGARIFLKDRHMVGAFVQAGYRSSVAVLGMALVTNIYGSGAVVPMMMVGSVPLFNVFAVLILTLEGPTHEESSLKENLLKAGKDIVTNPILLAILLGMAASWFEIRFPLMLERGMGYVADMAMPPGVGLYRSQFSRHRGIEKNQTDTGRHFYQIDGPAWRFPPNLRCAGAARRVLGRRFGHAGFPHHQHGLCYGGKYGRRRRACFQRSGLHHGALRFLFDLLGFSQSIFWPDIVLF